MTHVGNALLTADIDDNKFLPTVRKQFGIEENRDEVVQRVFDEEDGDIPPNDHFVTILGQFPDHCSTEERQHITTLIQNGQSDKAAAFLVHWTYSALVTIAE
ncbi:hypothetical protein V5735_01585 (plasmid) [Haladaptatus sp. SPP-AMP-3]|uniref:hypothetical protein n=1 Tax=Haladaptatus sp. SPP-AMP-3 TaxID=3121295 RepID=UPI003C2B59CE